MVLTYLISRPKVARSRTADCRASTLALTWAAPDVVAFRFRDSFAGVDPARKRCPRPAVIFPPWHRPGSSNRLEGSWSESIAYFAGLVRLTASRGRASALWMAASNCGVFSGFSRKAAAPCLKHSVLTSGLPNAVNTMTGKAGKISWMA